MNCAEWPEAERFFRNAQKKIEQRGFALPICEALNPGDRFDLGGVELEAILCQGHTPGGICLLDRVDRTLFTGDAINVHLWMQLPQCTGLPSLIQSLDALSHYRKAFDTILHGHAQGFLPADTIDKLRAGALEIVEEQIAQDTVYHYFGRTAMQHVYTSDGALIVYPKRLWQQKRFHSKQG